MKLKNLKRALRYLAVWSEPPSDDGVPRTLSYADDGAESESRKRTRKRRKKKDRSCLEKPISSLPAV
jgi:hypothetical protein